MADRALREQQEIVRIPAYDTPTNRGQTTLTGTAYTAYTVQDQNYWNCFPVTSGNGITKNEQEIHIVSREGLSLYGNEFDLSSIDNTIDYCVCIIGIRQIDYTLVGIWQSFTSSLCYVVAIHMGNNTGTLLGTFPWGMSSQIHIAEITVAAQAGVAITTPDEGYYALATAGAFTAASLTTIADADFPCNLGTPETLTGPMVQMNGTTYVMTTSGAIYNSDLNSISSWNGAGLIQAITYPDKGLGLARYKHHVVAFGEDSIEFFNDVGNPPPGSPLQRTDQAFIKIGCTGSGAFANVRDTLYWVSSITSGLPALWKLEGYTPVKLSEEHQSGLLPLVADRMQVVTMRGAQHLIFNNRIYPQQFENYLETVNAGDFPGTQAPMSGIISYCIDSDCFWNLSFNTDYPINEVLTATTARGDQFIVINDGTTSSLNQVVSRIGAAYNNSTTSQDEINIYGTIATYDIPFIVFFNSKEFNNTSRKFIRRINLVMDRVFPSASVKPVYFLYTKDDSLADGAKSTINYREGNLTNLGRIFWNNFGSGRKWTFAVVCMTDVPLRIKGLELIVAQGTH